MPMCRGKPIQGSGYRKDPADANGKAALDAIIAKRQADEAAYITVQTLEPRHLNQTDTLVHKTSYP